MAKSRKKEPKDEPSIDVICTTVEGDDENLWNLCVPMDFLNDDTEELEELIAEAIVAAIYDESIYCANIIDNYIIVIWENCDCCDQPRIVGIMWKDLGEEYMRLVVSDTAPWVDVQSMIEDLRGSLLNICGWYLKPIPCAEMANLKGENTSKKEAYGSVIFLPRVLLDTLDMRNLENFPFRIFKKIDENDEKPVPAQKQFIHINREDEGGCDA